jgi:hypothetical protein
MALDVVPLKRVQRDQRLYVTLPHMTKLFEEAIRRLRELPVPMQDNAALQSII